MRKQHQPGLPSAGILSETVLIVALLGVISGGIWSLYMADAPYHPDMARYDAMPKTDALIMVALD